MEDGGVRLVEFWRKEFSSSFDRAFVAKAKGIRNAFNLDQPTVAVLP